MHGDMNPDKYKKAINPELPSRHLFVANVGAELGSPAERFHQLLRTFVGSEGIETRGIECGESSDVIFFLGHRSHSFVTMPTIEAAIRVKEHCHKRLIPELSSRKLAVLFCDYDSADGPETLSKDVRRLEKVF